MHAGMLSLPPTSSLFQVLNNLKSALGELVTMGAQVRRMIAERKADIGRFESDLGSVVDEKTAADRNVRQLKAEQDDM